MIIVRIKPAVYSRRTTPPQDREYKIVGSSPVGNLTEIREVVFKKYGNKAIIEGETLEGEKIREEFI